MKITDCEIVRRMDDGRPVYRVPIALVHVNPLALRVSDEADAEVMAEHLRSGQERPLLIKANGVIFDGHRRLAGLRKLGHPTVDVVLVSEKDGRDAIRALLGFNTTTIQER